jgi:arsenite methyltransferase
MPARTIQETVKERYGAAAKQVLDGGGKAACCESSCCGGSKDPISSDLYSSAETAAIPEGAVLASLGCGNPTALAELEEGQTVLDLGSGGGIDVLLSARRVGPTGKAYGLDMTDEMLALARENQRKALAEAFRVHKPGGRFAVSDVVVRGAVPDAVRRSMELWVGCVAGALEEEEFKTLLADTGFTEVSIEPTRIYRVDDARAFLQSAGLDVEVVAKQVDGRFMGAFVRGTKPE